ncbi:LuxR C-terminal-related transcriptional regulator [Iamia majanohamensis]|uniref:LuxR C-terminal-related transcriptional regulator n=1 Tax=Iamia majanohamensis TaxID=467976 RepID=A0AAE9YB06_9ACTN|nr:LuxR family transcriptional regulator [Iamia majanohamensis]WCO67709.1 LuxR C-terminal-related transcriptional regulator [Iamia majanohamensis]
MSGPGGAGLTSPPDGRGALAGRTEERRVLAGARAAAAGGRAALVDVEGAPGIGKTALLRDLVDAAGPDEQVLHASAEEAEARLELGVVEQLLGEAAALGRAPTRARSADPLHAGAALRDLLAALALDGPVTVVVDDAQWCDPPSVHALTFALRRSGHLPLLAIVAHRPDALALEPLARLVADTGGARLRLGPLDVGAVRRLVADRCGVDLSWPAGERLCDHAGGNPLHAIALAEEVDPVTLASGLGPLPAPRSYTTLMVNRLAASPPEVEAVVAALAVVGWPVGLAVLEDLCGVRSTEAAVADAERRGFVVRVLRAGAELVDLAHPLLRSAVVRELGPERRAALHARAAGVTRDPPAQMAHRLAAARPRDPALAREAVRLARSCSRDGRPHSAVELLVAAAARLPVGAEADAALAAAADELLDLGDTSTARELLARLTPRAGGAHLELVRGHLALLEGDPWTARTALRRAWAARGDEAGRAAVLLATVASNTARAEEAQEWARAALATPSGRRDPGHALCMVASSWALRGDLAAGRQEVARWQEELGPLATAVPRGLLLLWDGALEEACAAFSAWIGSTGTGHTHLVDATARYSLADALHRMGDWDQALEVAGALASELDDAGRLLAAPMAHAVAAFVHAGRGDRGPAEAHLLAARRATEASGNGSGLLWQLVAAARAAAARGAPAEVVEHLGVLAELTADLALPEGVQPWRADLVEALVGVGDLDRAVGAAEGLRGCPRGGGPHARAGTGRALGLLAAACGDQVGADAAFEEALADDPAATGAFARARLELAAGATWRRQGRRRDAARVLGLAEDRLRALGAAPWVARAARESTLTGLAPRRRDGGPVGALTPAEVAVARVVAAGATNREAATRLSISVKTVETHLGRVFAKLGVRSRSELAARGVADLDP